MKFVVSTPTLTQKHTYAQFEAPDHNSALKLIIDKCKLPPNIVITKEYNAQHNQTLYFFTDPTTDTDIVYMAQQ